MRKSGLLLFLIIVNCLGSGLRVNSIAGDNTLLSSNTLTAQIVNLSTPKKIKILVSSGVPFAPGQLFSEKEFAVLDKNSKEIAIAVKVLARWPQDNSIRSLLVQFPYEVEHNYAQAHIRWGTNRVMPDIEVTPLAQDLPEGFIVLPAVWLCQSKVIGEQVPMGKHQFSKYDENIAKYYPQMRDMPLKGNISEDGYYDITHVFYQLYVRSGDDDYFRAARKEAIRYRSEIITEGPERGRHKTKKETRYIYMEAMIDDYLLTGDEKSLEIAGYMAEYLKSHFNPASAFFPRLGEHFWTEREVAFPFLGIISYYELTGNKGYLDIAQQIMENLYKTQNEWSEKGGFIHNLYSHDPEEGARPDEYGGSPFMTGLLLEAVIKYHQVTDSDIAKNSIFRALDWLMKDALSLNKKSFVYMTSDNSKNSEHPDLNLLIAHAFGYGYKISGYKRKDYLELGEKIFEEGINKGYLGDRKHFNQNYRSSGHFLAYVGEIASSPETKTIGSSQ